MWPAEAKQFVTDFTYEWFRAEEALKSFERLNAKAFMPSVQELRYAGRRFVQALEVIEQNNPLSQENITAVEKHFIEAIENCIKARHDAVDAAVQFIHKRMNVLVESVGRVDVIRHFPQFSLLEDEIKQVDEKIIASRKDRSTLDDSYGEILKEHSKKLVEFHGQLVDSEFAVRAALKAQKSKDFRALVITSCISFILGIGASILAAFIYDHGKETARSQEGHKAEQHRPPPL